MNCPVCARVIAGRGLHVPVPMTLSLVVDSLVIPAHAPVEAIQVCSNDCVRTLSQWLRLQREKQNGQR